jgi:uncharacterized membrane protein SpoIIM required for sporulation/ABC-type transport system involved in multi-copper enzyme maturation permease subunit
MFASFSKQVGGALIITRREVRDQFRDWRIIFPILVLTVFFPALMNFTARRAVEFVERYGAPIVGDRLIPFLLLIVGFFPISVSLVIALESFVGEKERRSIEPLLNSPLQDWQIFSGKLLAALVPPLIASYLGITVYLIGVYYQVDWSPPAVLFVQVILLTMVQALLMVSGAIVVSSQATSVRSANLLASFIIIPMALLIQAEAIIMFWASYDALWWIILGQVFIAGLLMRTGLAHFNREELLGKEIDSLNTGWIFRQFKDAFIGKSRGLLQWYRIEVRAAFKRLRTPLLIMVMVLIAAYWIGSQQAQVFVLPVEYLTLRGPDQSLIQGLDSIRFFSVGGAGTVFLHNLRAITLATLMGLFSFGVLGILIMMLPITIIGYLVETMAATGISPLTLFTALVLPHGVLEIPAILLTGAAILRLGAAMVAPAYGKTIGEAWLAALADWAKIIIGLVVPLFLGAAFLEIFVTPRVAIWLLGG